MLRKAPINILCNDEAFIEAKFMTEYYQFLLFRRDRNKIGGGKMVSIRKELLAKRLEDFKTKSTETFCKEQLIFKRNWWIIFTHRPPQHDKKVFFCETGLSDCHKMAFTIFRPTFIRLPAKIVIIRYR